MPYLCVHPTVSSSPLGLLSNIAVYAAAWRAIPIGLAAACFACS